MPNTFQPHQLALKSWSYGFELLQSNGAIIIDSQGNTHSSISTSLSHELQTVTDGKTLAKSIKKSASELIHNFILYDSYFQTTNYQAKAYFEQNRKCICICSQIVGIPSSIKKQWSHIRLCLPTVVPDQYYSLNSTEQIPLTGEH